MEYRRLGKSNLQVSAVGFGTCQIRLVSEQQAIDTLKRGFSLGVNLVHTAPDYEGADDLVAQAIEECAAGHEIKMGKLGQPIRVAVTGGAVSPPIDVTLALIGRERTLTRLQTAIEFIEARAAA